MDPVSDLHDKCTRNRHQKKQSISGPNFWAMCPVSGKENTAILGILNSARGVRLANKWLRFGFAKKCSFRFGFSKLTAVSVFIGSVFLHWLPTTIVAENGALEMAKIYRHFRRLQSLGMVAENNGDKLSYHAIVVRDLIAENGKY